MIFSERKKHILNALEENGVISIKEISEKLETSEITIRRDFEKLENEGFLTKVTGGAILSNKNNDNFENAELSIKQKKIQNLDQKSRVANAAAKLINEGDCVYLDCGTCMIPLIKILSKKKITIVTNNLTILQYINKPVAEIYVLGGKYDSVYEMNAGSSAEEFLKTFHFDYSILGCAGMDLKTGDIYTSVIDGSVMKKTALNQCDSSILLLDSSKLRKKSIVKISNIKQINYIICDKSTQDDDMEFPDNFIFV